MQAVGQRVEAALILSSPQTITVPVFMERWKRFGAASNGSRESVQSTVCVLIHGSRGWWREVLSVLRSTDEGTGTLRRHGLPKATQLASDGDSCCRLLC